MIARSSFPESGLIHCSAEMVSLVLKRVSVSSDGATSRVFGFDGRLGAEGPLIPFPGSEYRPPEQLNGFNGLANDSLNRSS